MQSQGYGELKVLLLTDLVAAARALNAGGAKRARTRLQHASRPVGVPVLTCRANSSLLAWIAMSLSKRALPICL